MIRDVKLPEISDNVTSGIVVGILVKAGDFVKAEQAVVELETEKATFEVPCPEAGKVVEVLVSEQDEVQVGQTVIKIDTEAEAGESAAPAAQPAPAPAPKPEPQESRQVEAEAAEPEVESPPQEPQEPGQSEPVEQPPREAPAHVSAAPAVRSLARGLGIDIRQVVPSDPSGQISREDVKEYVKNMVGGRQSAPGPSVDRPLPDFSKWGPVRREAMTITRKKIAETLSYAWNQVPHVTHHDDADITALEQFRAEYGPVVAEAKGKLTVTSILMKVIASALQTFPKFNASVDAGANAIIYKDFYHIAVAVDTSRGLVVPVVRDANKKSILQLSVELSVLAEKARNNKLTPDDMMGGTFTISNLGGLGGTGFSPIVYWPQVAILGVSRSRTEARYVDAGSPQRRLIMPLSVSYDHRLIDGSEAARFLRHVAEQLEKPFLLAVGA